MQTQFMNLEASGLSQEDLEKQIMNSIKGGGSEADMANERERVILESIISNLEP